MDKVPRRVSQLMLMEKFNLLIFQKEVLDTLLELLIWMGGITNSASSTDAVTSIVIPPSGGHGANIYEELGTRKVMIYSRLENDSANPDFITGNEFARIGVVKDPLVFDSTSRLSTDKASAVYALKVTSSQLNIIDFQEDDVITQTIGVGSTAIGRVVSWDSTTES